MVSSSTLTILKFRVKRVLQFWLWVIKTFVQKEGLTRAASLTFTTLLALVPLFALVFYVISIFPVFQHLQTVLQDFIFQNFVPGAGQAVQQVVDRIVQQAQTLPVPALLFLFITVVMKGFTLDGAVKQLWEARVSRRLWVSLMVYLSVLLFGPLLICLSIVVSSYLGSMRLLNYLPIDEIERIWFLVPSMAAFLAFGILYVIVPHGKVSVRAAAWGALFSTVLFELAKYLFTLYVVYFPTYRVLYGALAAIPLFLLWIYLSWSIFLLGIVVTRRLNHDKPLK